ncbi:hypothetical protein [Sinorhizobium medicae]|nr:hypothetical protein [Sinorhizobium medicae]
MNHFRLDFEPIARGLIYVDAGGMCSLGFQAFSCEQAFSMEQGQAADLAA